MSHGQAGGQRAPLLEPQHAADLLASTSMLLIDCDGVLWQGDHAIPNVPEALASFRALGKRLLFVTNNASKSRRQYVAKLAKYGIPAAAEEVVCSGYAAAAYLTSQGFAAAGKAVFLVGEAGLQEEFAAAGIKHYTLDDLHTGSSYWTPADFSSVQLPADIGAVVVAYDGAFTYQKLAAASACVRELPGCLFVATNLDAADHIGNGRFMPGAGCLVAAVATAAGRQPFVVGKGGDWLLSFLCQQHGVIPSEACMIGDRLDTDIAMGVAGGLRTLLPLTGVTTLEDAQAAAVGMTPDFCMPSLATLAGL